MSRKFSFPYVSRSAARDIDRARLTRLETLPTDLALGNRLISSYRDCLNEGRAVRFRRPCNLAVCARCRRETAIGLARTLLVPTEPQSPDWCFVTIAHPCWGIPPGSLEEFDPRKARGFTHARMRRSSEPVVQGCGVVELSLNVFNEESLWIPHVHLLVRATNIEQLRAAFRVKKCEPHFLRPTQVKRANAPHRCLGYMIKPDPATKRSVYLTAEGRRRTRQQRLTGSHRQEVEAFFAKRPIDDFLIIINGARGRRKSVPQKA